MSVDKYFIAQLMFCVCLVWALLVTFLEPLARILHEKFSWLLQKPKGNGNQERVHEAIKDIAEQTNPGNCACYGIDRIVVTVFLSQKPAKESDDKKTKAGNKSFHQKFS